MGIIRNMIIASDAMKDAKIGQRQAEDSVFSRIGQQPTFMPESNPSHLQLSRSINVNSEVQELEDDLRVNETGLAESPSLKGMNLLISVLFVCELLGSVLVMKGIGLQNPERLVFGAGLAAILFFLTSRLAVIQSRILFTILLIAYGAIVIGIAVNRSANGGDEYTTNAVELGQMVIMLATTIGPAWVFEHVWRRRIPVAVLSRKARGLRRRLNRLLKGQRTAQRKVDKIATDAAAWGANREKLTAIYNTTYNRHAKPADGQLTADMSSDATLTRRR